MAQPEKTTLLQGTLDMLILRSLETHARHGYGIAKWIQSTSGDVLTVEEGSLYPALHRMEKRGWIQSEWGKSESNRRAKYYKLSRSGRSQFARQVNDWESLVNAITLVLNSKTAEV